MNEREPVAAHSLSIAAAERETGLSKDTLRVWERRYGFPCPDRDAAGDRRYPRDQVERLRAIRRLIDAGHRPRHIVTLAAEALQALSAPAAAAQTKPTSTRDVGEFLQLIQGHDAHQLRRMLGHAALRGGLVDFVTLLVAPLNTAVREARLQGRFYVFEEHLYTECITAVLRSMIASIAAPQGTGRPRVVLTSFPGEPHGLGLLMAEALFALEGCNCMPLGPQTPIADIAKAAQAHQADIVALSFTEVLGATAVVAGLQALGHQLPPGAAIWAGGSNPALSKRRLPGVLPIQALDSLREHIAQWRNAASDAPDNPSDA